MQQRKPSRPPRTVRNRASWLGGCHQLKEQNVCARCILCILYVLSTRACNIHINCHTFIFYIKYIQIHSNWTAVYVQAVHLSLHHGGLSHIGLHPLVFPLGNITRPKGPFPVQTQVRAPGIKTMTLTAKVIHTAGLRQEILGLQGSTIHNY